MHASREADGDRPRAREEAWTPWANAALGAWLVTSPAIIGSGNRAMAASDVASGLAIVALALLALKPSRGWARWAATAVGLWLLLAPLVFHAPTAAEYLNDTAVGVLVVTFAVVIPGMPGLTRGTTRPVTGRDTPDGWSFNPSTWSQRIPPVVLALVGFFIARYLTAYQLGHIDVAWDPFFGGGTERVLDSKVSKAFPVADAGLGAIGYLLDALAGLMGGTRRWRTAPWIVVLFGFFVIPFGVVSVTLVIMQPVVVGAWCTLCLASALVSLLMIPFAADEVVAALQFVWRVKRADRSAWRAFWEGDALEAPEAPARTRGGGASVYVSLAAAAVLGLAIMAAPVLLGTTRPLTSSHVIVGALAATFAVIAVSEPLRAARFVLVPLGAWLAVSPFVLTGETGLEVWLAPVTGLALALLALPRGPVRARYGAWERFVV